MEQKETNNTPQTHHHSHVEVISSIVFMVLVVVGMYFLSGYLNH